VKGLNGTDLRVFFGDGRRQVGRGRGGHPLPTRADLQTPGDHRVADNESEPLSPYHCLRTLLTSGLEGAALVFDHE